MIGFHSVILRPDSVRRVTPPTTITAKTRTEENMSHPATGGGESTGSSAVAAALLEKNRGSKARERLAFVPSVSCLPCVQTVGLRN